MNKDDPVGTLLGPDGKELVTVKKKEQALGFQGAPRGNPKVSPAWREWGRPGIDKEHLRFAAESADLSPTEDAHD